MNANINTNANATKCHSVQQAGKGVERCSAKCREAAGYEVKHEAIAGMVAMEAVGDGKLQMEMFMDDSSTRCCGGWHWETIRDGIAGEDSERWQWNMSNGDRGGRKWREEVT